MSAKKRTEILIETERIIVMTPAPEIYKAICKNCLCSVEWLSPEYSAKLVNIPPRLIYRWIESGEIHFLESRDGAIRICRNSLLEKYQQPE